MRIFNSRLLDPNQEHQALIPLIGHLEGGWIGDKLIKWWINAELKLFMQTKTIKLNTQGSVAEFLVKGSRLSP